MADERKTVNDRYVTVNIDKVSLHPENPRKGHLSAIKSSIKANGFYGALVVQKSTGLIVVGNHRWQAAKELGFKKVPVVYVDVDNAEARRILLVDNRSSDIANWDVQRLADMLEEIKETEGLSKTGFDETVLAQLLAESIVPKFEPVSADDQSRLDERAKIKCPKCGHQFEA